MAFGLALEPPIRLRWYWDVLGDVADESSYDLAEGFGDRGYGLCDGADMVEEDFKGQYAGA